MSWFYSPGPVISPQYLFTPLFWDPVKGGKYGIGVWKHTVLSSE